MTELRAYSLETVAAALADEVPGADPVELQERAYSLIAIAETNHIPIEELLLWIHTTTPEKEWSLAEFRGYAHYRDPSNH